MSFDVPVLIIAFNRPELIEQQVEILRRIRVQRLYIAVDGARKNRAREDELVKQVVYQFRRQVDWDCCLFFNVREKNLGCAISVHLALKWLFANEAVGIILEDDILPHKDFFGFCKHALITFAEDRRIGSVGGRNELPVQTSDMIRLSRKFNCWGWATWRDRISSFDIEDNTYKVNYLGFKKMGYGWQEKLHLFLMHARLSLGKVDSWAYRYDFQFRCASQQQIIPGKNLISNRGLGNVGTHSKKGAKDPHKLVTWSNFKLENVPIVDSSRAIFHTIFWQRPIRNLASALYYRLVLIHKSGRHFFEISKK